jgi:hypothetical protein
MNKIEQINELTNTEEFKGLQTLGKKLHDDQRQFDLLSVYKDLIDEMAWSRLFAYVLDSTQNHGLSQTVFRQLLGQIPELETFRNSLPIETDTKTICITEWKTEKGRRIDILIKLIDKNGNTKGVIGIENKVDSGEQDNQIRDYQNSIILGFQGVPKVLLYLTPDGRITRTSDENPECPCFSISYNIISTICELIIPNSNGQAQVFLSVLKNHIDKLTNNQIMDKEVEHLITELYKNSEYRQAIKLIGQYSPSIKKVFDKISFSIKNEENIQFTLSDQSIDYHPRKSQNPQEFKIRPDQLSEICQTEGLHAWYILRCENTNPDFDDIFTLRLAIWNANQKDKDLTARQAFTEKVQNAFSFGNPLGTNKNWSQWICVWTGNNYKLSDMGTEDIIGLKSLLLKGIEDTLDEFEKGLEKLAKMGV